MHKLNKLISILKYNTRLYSKLNTKNIIIKEIVKEVDPFASIKITSAFNVHICPYDLHECPDSNLIRGQILTNQHASPPLNINFDIKIKDNYVEIINTNNHKNLLKDVTCLLEIPIKSNINVQSEESIEIIDMYSDVIQATANQNIMTKNLKSSCINLIAINGNLNCNGTTLAQKLDIQTKNKGKILLHKLQGDTLYCKTINGDIDVGACYVEKSNFLTENGNLNLRNIHKTTEIFVLTHGNVEMTGVNGNIYLKSNGGDLNIQFSEIVNDNIIVAEASENVIINVSDIIEHNSFIEMHSDNIKLDSSLSHLSDCLDATKNKHFVLGKEENNNNKLRVSTRGNLKFGKMSWADTVKIALGGVQES